jgi:hypothetical protein
MRQMLDVAQAGPRAFGWQRRDLDVHLITCHDNDGDEECKTETEEENAEHRKCKD